MGVVLEKHRDRLAEVMRLDVVSSEQDYALFWVIETCDEFQYGAFPSTVLPYYHLIRSRQQGIS